MTNIASLLDRNQAFARDPGARRDMPRLPFIPNLNLYILTCIDCRVDPAQVLGMRLGEALIQRNIGGRATPAVIRDIAYASYLVDTEAPGGPYFEVAVIHHTDCGSALLAGDQLRHGFASGSEPTRERSPTPPSWTRRGRSGPMSSGCCGPRRSLRMSPCPDTSTTSPRAS